MPGYYRNQLIVQGQLKIHRQTGYGGVQPGGGGGEGEEEEEEEEEEEGMEMNEHESL